MSKMTTVQMNKTVHQQFRHFCKRNGLRFSDSIEELVKCALTGSISGSFMEPVLVRKENKKE